nr:PQQ-dependent sugar dehydrogenase [Saprospiraceae bacterium]
LRDRNGDGRADVIKYWGDYGQKGKYGNAMRIHKGHLYVSTASEVHRHRIRPWQLLPDPQSELLLVDPYDSGPFGYEHIAKPLAFDKEGHMYVQFGAPSDCCQEENRRPGSPGIYPCPELEWHSGVWQFSDEKLHQRQADGKRYATGIRSIVGMEWNQKENTLYALQHGRDNMHRMWPDVYSPWMSAMLPSEELLRVTQGSNAGWPYYYYDQMQGKKLLNPEYGGDGSLSDGADTVLAPLMGFPGHWAPNDILFYTGDQFPDRYRNGAFIAFHGSTIRAPYPQAGYFIGFVPFEDGEPSGPWEVFADGFGIVDTIVNTSDAIYRPMGLAQGPDGSLYLSESEKGKIWRILFKGDPSAFGSKELATMEKRKRLPHIKTPDPVLDNRDVGRIAAGESLYNQHCGACHQADGKGDGTRFPPLLGSEWITEDRDRLISIILEGQSGEITVGGKTFVGSMPPMDYLSDADIGKILTYVRTKFGGLETGIQEVEVYNRRRKTMGMTL